MTIDTKQLTFILDNTPASQNIMLVGKHGIGKSRILENYYAKKGAKVVTLFLGQMSDPGDLIGLPEKNELTGKTDFMLPYWFPIDGKPVVLFLDELNRARPEVLQTIMDLTLNRKLAGKALPEGSRIISAVNNGNEYQLTDLDPALVSRFNIYEFAPSVEDWLVWAVENGIDSRISAFISENPEFLDGTDLENETENLERTPDRRSWERTSDVLKNFKEIDGNVKAMITGILGDRTTTILCRYISEHSFISAKEILCQDFSIAEKKLSALSLSDAAQINVSLFRFIESGLYDDEKLAAENLKKYFDFLGETERTELQSHFVSLCSAKDYPEALCFISEKCPVLYEEIMQLVMNM